jgi:hypothetical protein
MTVAHQTTGSAHVQKLDLTQYLRVVFEQPLHREMMVRENYNGERLLLHP